MNLTCWTREKPGLLLHKPAVIFETLNTRYMQTNSKVSMFHRAFFNSIIDKHQHMHFTFNNILV